MPPFLQPIKNIQYSQNFMHLCIRKQGGKTLLFGRLQAKMAAFCEL